jgi:hypothetical protein
MLITTSKYTIQYGKRTTYNSQHIVCYFYRIRVEFWYRVRTWAKNLIIIAPY